MATRHSEVICPRCLKLVRLKRSINSAQPLTWYMIDDDGRMHEGTCKPELKRPPKGKLQDELLPGMGGLYDRPPEHQDGGVGG